MEGISAPVPTKIFLSNMHSSLPQSVHACLRANTPQLCSRTPVHLFGNLCQVDTAGQVHASAMNSKNVCSGFDCWWREFDFSGDTSRSQECRIQDVKTIRGHNDLDVLCRLKSIQLI